MSRRISRLLLTGACLFAGCAMAEPRCTDFLAKLSDKTQFVEFVACTQDIDAQGKPFIARYRVKGTDALEAERYLNRRFGLPMLRYICCGWDSTFYSYRDKKTQHWYLLGMGSEETSVNTRETWPQIKYFYLQVSLATEDP
ncbi:DUF4952 domain-containing protein [Pseudomonas sp. TH15]|uniref:DUF4952 domain-containing protein n=1 Tax=Pseudomonas sp. TH15 TaxID=2796381 RepID=UPI001914CF6E|nr:DUF4952 domain-containing protein [Pseudomonas sp. TH15]MBK5512542.1 DUF4952 domain-containing protein [Pseudomonas sp. TH15]